MKKFLRQLLYLLPIPVLIAGINYVKDPANLFQGGKYERGIAGYLAQGYNVTNVNNYDERLLQKFFIEDMPACPTEIILGSSKVMLIDSSLSDGPGFINNGVSGASLEDDMAIFHLYEEKGCHLRKLIIGLDPYLLNDNHGQIRWKSLAGEYNDFKKELGLSPDDDKSGFSGDMRFKMEKYDQLLSISYFKTSFNYLIKRISNTYQPTRSSLNDKFTRLKDGAISYDTAFRNVSPDQIREKALDGDKINYSMIDFDSLSVKYEALFSAFITYLQNQKIEVIFFLAPYHPVVYDYYLKHKYYHSIFDADLYYRKFAREHKIQVFGAYDPGKYGFENTDFYDGQHAREKAIRTIMGK